MPRSKRKKALAMNLQALRRRDPMLVPDLVDNPYFGPASPAEHKQIGVIRTLRNDPIGQMFVRRQLDAHQHAAARRWQSLRETAGPRLPSSGDLQEPVDGGGRRPDGVTDRQMAARRMLIQCERMLGPRQHLLLTLILADGHSLLGATQALYPDDLTPPRRRFVGTWFREILSLLAREMGMGG